MKLIPTEHVALDSTEDNEWMKNMTNSERMRMLMSGTFKKRQQEARKAGHSEQKRAANAHQRPAKSPQHTGASGKLRHDRHTGISTGPARTNRRKAGDGAGAGGYAFTERDQAKGGQARWRGVNPEQRAAAARKAVMARWAKKKR
jgi:hypothetical protein